MIRDRLFQLGGPAKGEGSWISGIYENTSVNEGGTWKLSGMDLDYVWTAPSRRGWARVMTPPTAPVIAMAKEFPPDRPLPGSIAAPFPKVHTVPFTTRTLSRAGCRRCCCLKARGASVPRSSSSRS